MKKLSTLLLGFSSLLSFAVLSWAIDLTDLPNESSWGGINGGKSILGDWDTNLTASINNLENDLTTSTSTGSVRIVRAPISASDLAIGSNDISGLTFEVGDIIIGGFLEVDSALQSTNSGWTYSFWINAEQDLKLTTTGDVAAGIVGLVPDGNGANAVEITGGTNIAAIVAVGDVTNATGTLHLEIFKP